MKDNETNKQLQQEIRKLQDQSAEYRRLEEAHKEEKRRLVTLMGNLPGIAYRCKNDRQWTMEFISDGCIQLTGYSADDLVGNASLSYNDLIHSDDRSTVWNQIQEAVAEGKSFTLEYRINCRDGQEKWVREQGVGVFDDRGELLALEGFISDISEQKNNEAALRREMDFIDSLLQAAPAFFVAIDYDGKVLMMNQAMLTALGYKAEEVIGTDYLQTFVPKPERAMLSELFKTLTKPGGVTLIESRLMTRSGAELLLEWHGRAITDSEGKFRFFFGVGIDISEREQSERHRRDHLHFLGCLENINRAIGKSAGPEEMMSDVLEQVLSVMECDRAWLLYPCDPEADSFSIPMERTRPEYPGAMELSLKIPMAPGHAQDLREALAAEDAIACTEGTEMSVGNETAREFDVRAQMFMAIDPKIGKSWLFGIHQCSHARVWSESDKQLFKAIGQRVGDGLRSQLAFRNLAESEERMRSTLESMDDLVFALDTNGVFLDFYQTSNASLMYVFPDQYVGKHYREVLSPEAADRIEKAMTKVLSSGESQQTEYFLAMGDETRWFSCKLSLRKDQSGKSEGITAVARDITSRMETEKALKAREASLSSIFRAAPTGIGVVVDRQLKQVNQRLCEMTGYETRELMNQNARMLYPDEKECKSVGEEKYRQIRENGTGTIETRWKRKDGAVIDVLLSSTPINPDNLQEGVTFTALDITERRKSQETLRALLNAPTEAALLVDIEGTILTVNRVAAERLGKSSDELLGKAMFEYLPEPLVESRKAYGRDVVETRKPMHFEDEIEGRTYSNSIYPVFDSEGSVASLAVFSRDITEAREAASALRASEERYRQLIETMSDGVATADADGKITFANQRLCDMLGYSLDKLVGSDTGDFFDEENQRILEDQKSRRESGERSIYEIAWTRKDGSQLSTIVSPCAILDDDGEYKGSFAIITDITERKHLEEQFHHAQRIETVGRLAAGIAHDFNNMLSPILCYTELVLSDLLPADTHYDHVVEIQKAAERSRDLTQRLLAFSRKQVLELKAVNLSDLIMDFEKMLRGTLREDIEIKFFLDPDAGNIRGDISQIEQVLMNLVVNAQHAMPKAGVLGVEVARVEVDKILTDQHTNLSPGKYILLSVSDTGVGMDEETVRHCFEPFFTTRETSKGTGLGLATVYGIVKQHGGHITVQSEVNKGTSFNVYFPLTYDPLQNSKPKQPVRSSAVAKETIMVAEDERLLRDLVCTVLGSQGYTVISATSGTDCLSVLEEHDGPVHLLLTDVIMPGLNGKELFDRMSQVVPDLKVMYFSGYAADIIADHGVLDEGINFLKKPFSVAALSNKVREVLDS